MMATFYPNQEQYFHSIGIYDMDNDLRMRLSGDVLDQVEMSVRQIVKKFGEVQMYDTAGEMKRVHVMYMLNYINTFENDYKFTEVEDYFDVETLIMYYIK
jgi:hypothetical protein